MNHTEEIEKVLKEHELCISVEIEAGHNDRSQVQERLGVARGRLMLRLVGNNRMGYFFQKSEKKFHGECVFSTAAAAPRQWLAMGEG